MALQGTLETFSVPEVLRLLAGTRKSGLLALEGDRGAAKVWLEEGRIVTAESDHEQGDAVDAVLFDLLRFEEGTFEFEAGAEAHDGPSADADVEESLVEAERLLSEWREIEAVVPSLDVHVRMVDEIGDESITVTAEQWRSLAMLGGGTTAGSLGARHGLGEFAASRLVRELVDAGLVEVRTDGPVDEVDEPEVAAWTDADEDDADGTRVVDHGLSHDEVANLGANLSGFVARSAEPTETAVDEDLAGDAEEMEYTAVADVADVDEEPFDEDVDEDVDEQLEPAGAGTTESPDAFLSQLATLSPKSAAASDVPSEHDAVDPAEGDEEINRNLLLKFLSSAKN